MSKTVVVTGGTGTLGRLVVPRLQDAGYRVRVLSRTHRATEGGVEHVTGDLLAGTGLRPALEGADTVLHLAGGPKGDDAAARALIEATRRSTVSHVVYISVIGADRVPLKWFESKLAAEQAVEGSGLPWTTLRAAQFHDLVLTVAEKMAKLPVVPVPGGLRFQPVDADEVAERMVELTLDTPRGRVDDLAGPKIYGMGDLVRSYLEAHDRHRMMLPVRMPGKAGKAYRAGANLAASGATHGKRTWEEFLKERVGATPGR